MAVCVYEQEDEEVAKTRISKTSTCAEGQSTRRDHYKRRRWQRRWWGRRGGDVWVVSHHKDVILDSELVSTLSWVLCSWWIPRDDNLTDARSTYLPHVGGDH